MKRALNATDIRKKNRRLILDTVFNHSQTSRAQLSKELSLSKPAISENLEYLLELGVVMEGGESSTSPNGGRRSVVLRLNSMHKYIIAVNLNFTNPVFVLGNLGGEILRVFDIHVDKSSPPESCIRLVIQGIRTLLDDLGEDAGNVYCIAVAAPGVFSGDGALLSSNAKCGGVAWWDINLKQRLSEAFPYPVFIKNDIKSAALGEWFRGAGEQDPNLLYVSCGLGLGSAIILGGQLLEGVHYSAGESYDYSQFAQGEISPPFEDITSIPYLKSRCLTLPAFSHLTEDTLHFSAIVQAYAQGDPQVAAIVTEVCQRLAAMAFNFMNFLSVQRVVFGGEYHPFSDCFLTQLTALFRLRGRPMPVIRATALGKLAGIHGLLYQARLAYFQEICTR